MTTNHPEKLDPALIRPGRINKQILMGFHELVPEGTLKECGITEKDLALIITGMPAIDVEDWRGHCEVEKPRGFRGHGGLNGFKEYSMH